MIHKLQDKRQIAQRKKILKTFLWVGVFLFLVFLGLFRWGGAIFTRIGVPIWKFESATTNKIAKMGYLVRTKASVFNENEKLLQVNADLRNSMIDYEIIKKENDQLKELMGRLPMNNTFILGTILTKPNRSPYDTIIIDVGSNVGISVGDEVFANVETPIGEINKVYLKTSLVVLYSNPGKTTEAMLDGSNASVELVGRGGGNFEMMIPLDLSSENGTMVVLSGNPTQIVAIIEKVISTPTDPIKKVILRSPVNIQNLKWVQVKKN